MRKIKYIRKKLKDRNWIQKRIDLLLYYSKELNSFWKFECSNFFRGYEVASRNRIWASKREKQISRQLTFLETTLKTLKYGK